MSDNPNEHAHEQSASSESWQEVGQQFEALGRSLAAAFRTAVNDEDNRQRMHQMQGGLESMVSSINEAIHEASQSPGGQQVRNDMEKAAATLRSAGEQAYQDIRPSLLTALKDVTRELEKLAGRMEKPSAGGEDTQPGA